MRRILPFVILSALTLTTAVLAADAKAKPKVTYQDHVSTVFRNRCNSCHNGDKQKGGLNLENFSTAMQGGGSGKVIEPGDPDGSTLLQLVSHKDEPKMPPNSPKIPDAEIDLIKQWIEGGALENSGSVAAVASKPKFEFKLDPSAMGKPAGPPAMPEKLVTEPFVVSPRPNAVVAMANSPWAPLIALAGHKQVLLYRTNDSHLVGVLPFPEGTIHVLRFSRSGDLLLAGGGRGGQSGLAVVWNVKTGQRVFEIGKEYDAVLAADISPDQGLVALGGPSKVLRVYSTADGQLVYEQRKHTEWVTALEFSPDGVLLASGDRNNGLVVWEAHTGREFYDLRGHTAMITDISWRLDSNVVASSSEDGTVRLWEMQNGNPIKSWGAHGGGVESVRFAKDGRLVTTGRDRVTRLWDQNGNKQRDFEGFGDLALEAVFNHEATQVIAADWSGEVRVWDAKDGKRLANLAANPAPLAVRLEQTKAALAAAESALKPLAAVQNAPAEKAAALALAQKNQAEAQQAFIQKTAGVAQAEQALQAKTAAEPTAAAALNAAQTAAQTAVAAKPAADNALADASAAEAAGSKVLADARAAVERAQAQKMVHDRLLSDLVAALKAATVKTTSEGIAAEVEAQTRRSGELRSALADVSTKQAAAQSAFEKLAAAKANAAKAVEAAQLKIATTAAAAKTAQEILAKVQAEKATAATAVAQAKTAVQTATALATTRKGELDRATAEKTAADKALAAQKPAIDAAAARVGALKSEVDALLAEKPINDAAKAPMAATTARNP